MIGQQIRRCSPEQGFERGSLVRFSYITRFFHAAASEAKMPFGHEYVSSDDVDSGRSDYDIASKCDRRSMCPRGHNGNTSSFFLVTWWTIHNGLSHGRSASPVSQKGARCPKEKRNAHVTLTALINRTRRNGAINTARSRGAHTGKQYPYLENTRSLPEQYVVTGNTTHTHEKQHSLCSNQRICGSCPRAIRRPSLTAMSHEHYCLGRPRKRLRGSNKMPRTGQRAGVQRCQAH